MTFHKVCTLDDVWEGEMEAFDVDGVGVLVVNLGDGNVKAVQARCPHQDVELVDGEICDNIVTCKMHLWQFDVCSGKGVNPSHASIAQYPVKIEGEDIFVSVEGVEEVHIHS